MRNLRKFLMIIGVLLIAGWGLNQLLLWFKIGVAQPTIDWHAPSETKAYPNLTAHPNAWLDVNTNRQRVYVKDGRQTLYTMYCSTGTGMNATPTGTFHIQAERGKVFYNPTSGEGARYWVSWKDHGVYLFHSVPIDKHGAYIPKEAEQLGKTGASHGCVRLSVADAQWVYQHVPYGMKVVIHA